MEENRRDQLTQSSNSEGGRHGCEATRENEIEIVTTMPAEENIRRLYEASRTGSIQNLKTLIREEPDILRKVLVSSNSTTVIESPLHLSVSHGHLEFSQCLLNEKPELACEVDTHQRTPLHLASANGETEIVRALLEKNIGVCLVRDVNGLIPLHHAVIKGKIETIQALVNARPQSVWTKLIGNGQTVLHLCVKHNHLEVLKLLMTETLVIHDKEFLNTTDGSGNTVMDLSLMLRQVEMVRYLLEISGTSTIAPLDSTSNTAAGVQQTESSAAAAADQKIGLRQRLQKLLEYKGDWLQEVQNTMMLVATVIATVTFQGSINPPGGVWQQDTSFNKTNFAWGNGIAQNITMNLVGTSIMAYQRPEAYWVYSLANTISFDASVCVLLLIISRLPRRNKICDGMLTVAMCAAVLFLVVAYLQGISMLRFYHTRSTMISNLLTVRIVVSMIHIIGYFYTVDFCMWVWKTGLCKFMSRLPILLQCLFGYVFWLPGSCCMVASMFAFYRLAEFVNLV